MTIKLKFECGAKKLKCHVNQVQNKLFTKRMYVVQIVVLESFIVKCDKTHAFTYKRTYIPQAYSVCVGLPQVFNLIWKVISNFSEKINQNSDQLIFCFANQTQQNEFWSSSVCNRVILL